MLLVLQLFVAVLLALASDSVLIAGARFEGAAFGACFKSLIERKNTEVLKELVAAHAFAPTHDEVGGSLVRTLRESKDPYFRELVAPYLQQATLRGAAGRDDLYDALCRTHRSPAVEAVCDAEPLPEAERRQQQEPIRRRLLGVAAALALLAVARSKSIGARAVTLAAVVAGAILGLPLGGFLTERYRLLNDLASGFADPALDELLSLVLTLLVCVPGGAVAFGLIAHFVGRRPGAPRWLAAGLVAAGWVAIGFIWA